MLVSVKYFSFNVIEPPYSINNELAVDLTRLGNVLSQGENDVVMFSLLY